MEVYHLVIICTNNAFTSIAELFCALCYASNWFSDGNRKHYSRAALYQHCALFDTRIKFSTQIVFLVTSVFWYSAIPDLTSGNLYSHFCVENSAHFAWALLNTAKTGFQMKVLLVRNNLVFIEVKRWFHSKVMINSITYIIL